jgi:hypothetical protein
MSKYALTSTANVANWMLIALLILATLGSIALVISGEAYAWSALFFSAALLVGVLLRSPITYLAIALFSLIGLAANLKSAHFAVSALNAGMLALSVYIRGNLFVRVSQNDLS